MLLDVALVLHSCCAGMLEVRTHAWQSRHAVDDVTGQMVAIISLSTVISKGCRRAFLFVTENVKAVVIVTAIGERR